ncbi:NADH-ubiquinone oxidoreductase chain 1 [Platanthera zijinensis]|uniref:NADH-ubiquinone oxidoreductase chain 1 n=1 Tax=Platanthera zijinensis TaxID=2320716 RepID=A0AAP0B7F1_9ASPA
MSRTKDLGNKEQTLGSSVEVPSHTRKVTRTLPLPYQWQRWVPWRVLSTLPRRELGRRKPKINVSPKIVIFGLYELCSVLDQGCQPSKTAYVFLIEGKKKKTATTEESSWISKSSCTLEELGSSAQVPERELRCSSGPSKSEGKESNSEEDLKCSFLGALRSAAQMVPYEVSIGMILIVRLVSTFGTAKKIVRIFP